MSDLISVGSLNQSVKRLGNNDTISKSSICCIMCFELETLTLV